jgi:hypothetical protein
MGLGPFQPRFDKFNVLLRCRYPFAGFLLKNVQDVNRSGKPHRIDGTVGVAVKVVHDFEHPGAAKPCNGFASGDLPPRCAQWRAYLTTS